MTLNKKYINKTPLFLIIDIFFNKTVGKKYNKKLIYLLVLMLISALFEVVSIGSVLPFIGVIISPDTLFKNENIAKISKIIGIENGSELMLPLTLAFITLTLTACGIRLSVLKKTNLFVANFGAELAKEVYRHILYQEYSYHLKKNSSSLISAIIRNVDATITFGVMSALQFISSFILLITIISVLLYIDYKMSIITGIILGGIYGLTVWFTKKRLKANSLIISNEQNKALKALQEGLGAIRDIILDGSQIPHINKFSIADTQVRKNQGISSFIASSPRYFMESIGVSFIAFLVYKVGVNPESLTNYIPKIGALVLGAQRLLPTMQLAFSSWAYMEGSNSSIKDTLKLLELPIPSELINSNHDQLQFKNRIIFETDMIVERGAH